MLLEQKKPVTENESEFCDDELTYEWCPHCEFEVELPVKLGYYPCPKCGVRIINCSMCETGCTALCQVIIKDIKEEGCGLITDE